MSLIRGRVEDGCGGVSFEHQGLAFNLLDTPGHQDFSEDTYRT